MENPFLKAGLLQSVQFALGAGLVFVYFFYTFLKGMGFEGWEYNDNPDNRDTDNIPLPVPFWRNIGYETFYINF